MNIPLLERHADDISGVLSCYDRIIITGTVPGICYAGGMTCELYKQGVLVFDFENFAKPFAEELIANAGRLAEEAGIEIEYIRSPGQLRKEDRIAEILQQRGTAPGLVHIFSVLETCNTYRPWHDKNTGKTFLRPRTGKCLHYYFYFIDPAMGLCYLRVPTWIPFRLQFYCNGHNVLAAKLTEAGIPFTQTDNTFPEIADFNKAQELADSFSPDELHALLDKYAALYCPVVRHFAPACGWSFMQVEYATDIVFKSPEALQPVYEDLTLSAVLTAKPRDISTFLGHAWQGFKPEDIGSRFNTRFCGTCIKHYSGKTSIKMYDKFGRILRIETTSNDVSFFKHHRKVEHRDGTSEMKNAPLKKSIYSLRALRDLMHDANRRYLMFLSDLEDPSAGLKHLQQLSRPVREGRHTFRGFNLFDAGDLSLLETLLNGAFNISGLRNRDLRALLPGKTSAQVSRMLKRLLTHKLIKKAGNTYKYYLTAAGRRVIMAAAGIRRFFIIPALGKPLPQIS